MRRESVGPKDGADRQKEYRDRQKAMGRKPRLVYLTDAEKAAFDQWLAERRSCEP